MAGGATPPPNTGGRYDYTTLNESLNFTYIALDALRNVLGISNLAFNSLIEGAKVLARNIQQANVIQSQSLAINKTLAGLTKGNTAAIGGLAGGFYENTQALLDLRRAGFDQLNPRTLQLAGHMKQTGQSSQALFQMNKMLFNQGGLTENSLNSLSEDILYNSAQYNITTTDLIGAVNGLSEKMATFGMMGISGPMSKAVQGLTAKLGAQFGGSIGEFAKLLVAPSTSSALLSRLGLLELRQEMASGELSPKQMQDKLAEAIAIGSERTQSLTGGAGGELGEVFTALLKIAGGEGGLGQLATQLDRAVAAPEGPDTVLLKQFEQLSTILGEIVEPLKMGFAALLGPVLNILNAIKTPLRFLVTAIFPAIIGLLTQYIAQAAFALAVSIKQSAVRFLQNNTILGGMAALAGALYSNAGATLALTASIPVTGWIGIAAGLTAMGVALAYNGQLEEERLTLEKNKYLDEQRRNRTTAERTNSFMALAKAISADAGLAVAFRPDVLDPMRRADLAKAIVDYLEDIRDGVYREPSEAVNVVIGGN